MRKKKVEYALQVRVCKYLEHIWLEEEFESGESEVQIFNKLSDSLRKELLLHSNGRILADFHKFTKIFSDEVLEKMSQSIKAVHFAPGDVVFRVKTKIYYRKSFYNCLFFFYN